MQVTLSKDQSDELKQYIFEITKEGIAEAKKNAGLDKPFLKQKYMAEYLGISVNTLKVWEIQGLPSIVIEGIKFFSKEEVSKWVLRFQK